MHHAKHGFLKNHSLIVVFITGTSSGFSLETAQLLSEQGHIDVLVNNAGMGIGGPLEFATEGEIRERMDANSKNPIYRNSVAKVPLLLRILSA